MESKIVIQKIRDAYTQKAPSKLDELVKLDREVKRPAKILAYTAGTIGSFVLGSGMCLAMGVVGRKKAPGIVIGTAGIAILAGNYPLYKAHLKARKEEYADRILELSRQAEQEQTMPDETEET